VHHRAFLMRPDYVADGALEGTASTDWNEAVGAERAQGGLHRGHGGQGRRDRRLAPHVLGAGPVGQVA